MPHPSAADLLAWYDRGGRVLPWRADTADPYRVWLSEVMLQQTTVAAVRPRFERFLLRFPDVAALARAPWEEVSEEWAGLGYYARARNLHAAARAVVARGGFPRDLDGLRALPGVGPYTAAAVAAICFGEAVVPLDANVERVVARVFAVEEALPASRPALRDLARRFSRQQAGRERPGDLVQALMDLGATVCTPRRPACAPCPWRGPCEARQQGRQEELPRKAAKAARGALHGVHFLLRDGEGRILLRRRPEGGLLGGMLEIPGTPWRERPWKRAEALAHAPAAGLPWRVLPGEARHGFSHRDLTMRLWVAAVEALPAGAVAMAPEEAGRHLPTAMRRLLALIPPVVTSPHPNTSASPPGTPTRSPPTRNTKPGAPNARPRKSHQGL